MKVKIVQLESGAFLTDVDFITMTAEQRGVYVTLILFLNCNNGRCRYDEQILSALCNCEKFAQVWEKIKNKFTQKNGWIRHKRVGRELKAAKNRLQHARKKGLTAAKARWHKQCTSNTTSIASTIANVKRNVNVKENKNITYTNTKEPISSFTNTIRLRSTDQKSIGI